MKFCLVLPGYWQCYDLFANYSLRLHMKSFIPTKRDLSLGLPGSCFVGTKLSDVFVTAYMWDQKVI